MNKLINIFILLLILLPGCLTEDTGRGTRPGVGDMIRFHFTLEGSSVATKTIAAEDGEDQINDLFLLFFEASANGSGILKGYYEVPAEDIPGIEEMDDEGFSSKKFSLSLSLDTPDEFQGAYNILAVANIQNNLNVKGYTTMEDLLPLWEDMSENYVIQYMATQIEGVETNETDNSRAMLPGDLLMSGRSVKAAGANEVDCRLVRAVSRFDVINDVSTSYRLVSASIWNAFTVGAVWDDGYVNYNDERTKRYYGLRNNDGYTAIQGGLYAFENISPEVEENDTKTTCLILGLQPESGPDQQVTYYRVNVISQPGGQYLRRNHVYQLTIKGVNGRGEPNEQDAYEKGKMLLDTSVNAWERDEDDLIKQNGNFMLAIPTHRTVFGPDAEERRFYVYTAGEGQLQVHDVDMPTGMSARIENERDLYISVDRFSALSRRIGAIKLSFAGLEGVIEIVQSGEELKHLTLSRSWFPSWPTSGDPSGIPDDIPITVTSSGEWTAEIHLDGFSFDKAGNTTSKGKNGDDIYLYTTGANTELSDRFAFVLISLDDDPEHYSNVVVLSQAGTGNFTISPDIQFMKFDATGTLIEPAGYKGNIEFVVRTGNVLDTWEVELREETPGGKFTLITGEGTFMVAPIGSNNDELATAIVRISHLKGGSGEPNYKEIQIEQRNYDFSLSPSSISNIPVAGKTTDPIRVVTSLPGATFSATVSSTLESKYGLKPFLIDKDGNENEIITSQLASQSFNVKIPGLYSHVDIDPVITVQVTLDQTGVEKELVIYQTHPKDSYLPINAQSFSDLGRWDLNNVDHTMGQWRDELKSSANFGPSGVVPARGPVNATYKDASRITMPINDNSRRIFNMNGVAGNSLNFVEYRDQYTTFVISTWNNAYKPFTILGIGNYTVAPFESITQRIKEVKRTVYTGFPEVLQTEIWDYIFNSGPFGEVVPENVKLHPQEYPLYMTVLSEWPDTFIPLIMMPADKDGTPDPTRALMGIDPTNNLIWIGHKDLLGNDYGSNYNNWTTNNPDNKKFMLNLQAWMINVANFGDNFNQRFKQKVKTCITSR